MHGRNPAVLEHIARYLADEARSKKQMDLDTSDWPRWFPKDIPRQTNGYDCGVFAIKFADFASRDCDFSFSQKDMTYFRRRLAAELMQMEAK
eukprot:scaffold368576_cov45-Prasinocladus_malaysianus.AAC.1